MGQEIKRFSGILRMFKQQFIKRDGNAGSWDAGKMQEKPGKVWDFWNRDARFGKWELLENLCGGVVPGGRWQMWETPIAGQLDRGRGSPSGVQILLGEAAVGRWDLC